MADKKPARLQDLFQTGKEVTLDFEIDDETFEVKMWMRKPLPAQAEEALTRSRGQQVRRKRIYQDKDSDEYLTLVGDVETIETRDEVMDRILMFDHAKLRQTAYNEVLYNPENSPHDDEGKLIFGEAGQYYLDLLDGIGNRMDEIRTFNEGLEEEDEALELTFKDDEELVKLRKQEDIFENAVTDRIEELTKVNRAEFKGVKLAGLQKELVKRLIEGDSNMHWYAEYQKWMLYHSCRALDDHKRSYFRSPDELAALPGSVLMLLQTELDQFESGQEAIKNSLSLQLSSDS